MAKLRMIRIFRETAMSLNVKCPARIRAGVSALALCLIASGIATPDTTPLTILDPNLQVTTYIGSGITQPIGIVFLSTGDALVLEKASGQVKRVLNGVV